MQVLALQQRQQLRKCQHSDEADGISDWNARFKIGRVLLCRITGHIISDYISMCEMQMQSWLMITQATAKNTKW